MTLDITSGLERALQITDEFQSLQGDYEPTPDMVAELNAEMRAHLGPFWVDPLPRENFETDLTAGTYNCGFVPINGYHAHARTTIVRWEYEGRLVTSLNRLLRSEMLEQLAHWLARNFGAPLKKVPEKQFFATRDLASDFRAMYHGSGCRVLGIENLHWSGCSKPLYDTSSGRDKQLMCATFPEGAKITCLMPRVKICVTNITDADDLPKAGSSPCAPAAHQHTVPAMEIDTVLYVRMPDHPKVAVYAPRKQKSNAANREGDSATENKVRRAKSPPPVASLDWYLDN